MLELRGSYCTEPAEEVVFPVKVLFLLDQSDSLQCTDSQHRRFGALGSLISDLRKSPSTSFGFIGFSSWSRQQGFTRKQSEIDPFLDPAGGLGPATDYQGALATAVRMLEEDMVAIGPATRARTRYVVILVSDGVPEPRCNAGCEDDKAACSDGVDNDGDGIIDGSDPDCVGVEDSSTHPDNNYGVCNTRKEVTDDVYVDYQGLCPAYNQPEQIMARVSSLLELEDIYSAGDVALHTVLLFSPQGVVEGACPGASTLFGYNHDAAKGLLQAMAQAGGGAFRDVNIETEDDQFLRFDFTSLRSEQWMSELVAYNANARRDGEVELDSDGDGLSDRVEEQLGTRIDAGDSDKPKGDGYSDLLEHALGGSGFDPLQASLPAVSCGDGKDFDGDGLDNCEEDALGTDRRAPDTDGDGLTDWLELVSGTDPVVSDGLRDLDFDGVANRDEIRGGTDPLVPDAEIWRSARIRYAITDRGNLAVPTEDGAGSEERHCYDFAVTSIPLVTPYLAAARGRNRVIVYTLEKPLSLAGSIARGHVACAEVSYQGPSDKVPESGVLDLGDAFWKQTREGLDARLQAVGECLGADPESFGRADVLELASACLPPKVQIGRILYGRDTLVELLQSVVREDLSLDLPDVGTRIFVPIESFVADRDCVRTAELTTLDGFLTLLASECAPCLAARAETAASPCGDACTEAP
ncbi:MAG: VWA domain-containing protein [Deltaproteobacteria bacterium]|nr:VWA domain-containing protein [Deltaproteobacteria bacterium]